MRSSLLLVNICFLYVCVEDAFWATWGEWSICDNKIKCGAGNQTRNRTCTQSSCPNQNIECPIFLFTYALNQTETQNCTENCTVVNGTWSDWTDWSNCSVACGGSGVSMRTRNCTNVQNGGLECLHLDNITRSMYENETADCYYFCRSKNCFYLQSN